MGSLVTQGFKGKTLLGKGMKSQREKKEGIVSGQVIDTICINGAGEDGSSAMLRICPWELW